MKKTNKSTIEQNVILFDDLSNLVSTELDVDIPDEILTIVRALKGTSLRCELVGKWLWISGDTKPQREKLKSLKCRWSSNREMWYFHTGKYHSYHSKESFETIRTKYGHKNIKGDE